MRVQMKSHITGYRNGEPWPLKGEVIDLPANEARDLILGGHAKEAPDATDTGDTGGAIPEPDDAGEAPTDDDSSTEATEPVGTPEAEAEADTEPEPEAKPSKSTKKG